jgi:hypothetical protein
MKESVIEKKVVDYAKSLDILSFKFVSPTNKGVPDRLFIKNGKILFIEFKMLGKEPTVLQKFVIEKMRNQGANIAIVDNVDKGKEIIKSFFFCKNLEIWNEI